MYFMDWLGCININVHKDTNFSPINPYNKAHIEQYTLKIG